LEESKVQVANNNFGSSLMSLYGNNNDFGSFSGLGAIGETKATES
jgi:hypothetical protein